jgi:hypothetical protein
MFFTQRRLVTTCSSDCELFLEREWFVSTWFGNTLWLIALGKFLTKVLLQNCCGPNLCFLITSVKPEQNLFFL